MRLATVTRALRQWAHRLTTAPPLWVTVRRTPTPDLHERIRLAVGDTLTVNDAAGSLLRIDRTAKDGLLVTVLR